MEKPDPGIEEVRDARRKISHEADNDPAKLIQHYIEYQKRLADRLVEGPEQHEEDRDGGLLGSEAPTDAP